MEEKLSLREVLETIGNFLTVLSLGAIAFSLTIQANEWNYLMYFAYSWAFLSLIAFVINLVLLRWLAMLNLATTLTGFGFLINIIIT